ncbi:MAG: hypothetical protein R2705_12665 [Ilumatobacteraceae bacterium]
MLSDERRELVQPRRSAADASARSSSPVPRNMVSQYTVIIAVQDPAGTTITSAPDVRKASSEARATRGVGSEPGVPRGLPAAGLSVGNDDLVSEATEHPNRRYGGGRVEGVDDTRHEQGDSHGTRRYPGERHRGMVSGIPSSSWTPALFKKNATT